MTLTPSRRQLLAAPALLAAAPAMARGGSNVAASPAPLPDLSFLRSTPLMDRERLGHAMRAAGLDAIVATHPANVFYLTNHWPQLDRMGLEGSGIAIVPADPAKPIALVMHAFLYYYTHSPETDFTDRMVFTYTQPTGPAPSTDAEPPAQAARTMAVVDQARLTALDKQRMRMFALTQPASADASWALSKAIKALGLATARVGIDDPVLAEALGRRGFEGTTAPGENVIRSARQHKSPAELVLMRHAARANMEAAVAAAQKARTLGSAGALRAAFYAEAAARGNIGHFMVIAGTSSEVVDQPFIEGSAISIDCVSTCRFYHGDFARTVFIGEPPREIRTAISAIQVAWHEIRDQLRPGMRFADVSRIGKAALKAQGADLNVSFTPHSVGLFHTDHPQPSLIAPRVADEMRLEENMVLSVDCPVFMAGLGGTIHYEDLMLIGNGPAEAIHAVPPPILIA